MTIESPRANESVIAGTSYEVGIEKQQERARRSREGGLVIRLADVPLEQNRQGLQRWFLSDAPIEWTAGSAIQDWDVFVSYIRKHSGKHRHQGGLVIYVVKGEGYSVVEGTRVDWKAGDLLLLPVTPGGVEHQHFSSSGSEDDPAIWAAFIFRPMHNAVGSYVEHRANHPDFRENGHPES